MDPHRLGLVSARLHHFQLVAQLGSIRRAALALNVAPSSISRTIRQLEQDLGVKLFERVRQKLKLTSAGELLVYHARASFAELNRACAFLDDLQGLRRGRVNIAVVESVSRRLLPDALSVFWRQYPGIAIDVKVLGSRQIFDAVSEGECELGIAFDVRTRQSGQRMASASLNIGALMRPDHPLAKRKEARLVDFCSEPALMSDTSLTLGRLLEEALHGSSVQLSPRATTNSIALMTDFAARGEGVSFQTRLGVEDALARGELVFVRLRDPRLTPRVLALVTRSKAHLPEAPRALAKLLAKAIEALHEA